mmetsp:Transcript_25527/g.64896  ORF Transcript_25527/g.64896 Transcript_25527/m.64896 type:complete len:314 (-) Transcript_25527:104-1045(-)
MHKAQTPFAVRARRLVLSSCQTGPFAHNLAYAQTHKRQPMVDGAAYGPRSPPGCHLHKLRTLVNLSAKSTPAMTTVKPKPHRANLSLQWRQNIVRLIWRVLLWNCSDCSSSHCDLSSRASRFWAVASMWSTVDPTTEATSVVASTTCITRRYRAILSGHAWCRISSHSRCPNAPSSSGPTSATAADAALEVLDGRSATSSRRELRRADERLALGATAAVLVLVDGRDTAPIARSLTALAKSEHASSQKRLASSASNVVSVTRTNACPCRRSVCTVTVDGKCAPRPSARRSEADGPKAAPRGMRSSWEQNETAR